MGRKKKVDTFFLVKEQNLSKKEIRVTQLLNLPYLGAFACHTFLVYYPSVRVSAKGIHWQRIAK